MDGCRDVWRLGSAWEEKDGEEKWKLRRANRIREQILAKSRERDYGRGEWVVTERGGKKRDGGRGMCTNQRSKSYTDYRLMKIWIICTEKEEQRGCITGKERNQKGAWVRRRRRRRNGASRRGRREDPRKIKVLSCGYLVAWNLRIKRLNSSCHGITFNIVLSQEFTVNSGPKLCTDGTMNVYKWRLNIRKFLWWEMCLVKMNKGLCIFIQWEKDAGDLFQVFKFLNKFDNVDHEKFLICKSTPVPSNGTRPEGQKGVSGNSLFYNHTNT